MKVERKKGVRKGDEKGEWRTGEREKVGQRGKRKWIKGGHKGR